MARFGHLLGRKQTGPLPQVAVCLLGLGNPGPQYADTRHNVGWMVLDRWTQGRGHRLRYEKKGPALVAAAQEGADTILLVKPQTFMNRSGQAATWIKRHYGPQRTLVIYDEMDLPLGRFKFATTGSAGGHNGLKSLIGDLGTKDFDRLKVGIGHRGEAVGVDYVLEPFDYGDRAQVETLLDEAAKWVQLYIDRGIAVATQELQRSQRGRGQKPNQESPEEG